MGCWVQEHVPSHKAIERWRSLRKGSLGEEVVCVEVVSKSVVEIDVGVEGSFKYIIMHL